MEIASGIRKFSPDWLSGCNEFGWVSPKGHHKKIKKNLAGIFFGLGLEQGKHCAFNDFSY